MLSLLCLQHDRWRLSTVNRDYSVCPSYPPAVIVPKDADDDMLKKVAKFRQGGRFPVLCYYHRKNGVVRCFFFFFTCLYCWHAVHTCKKQQLTFQVIMRSSQPLTGANRKRCREDEHLLQAVIDGSDKGYIIDTRSSQQAQQARMTGGGFESKSSYSCWKRLHRQMERCVRGWMPFTILPSWSVQSNWPPSSHFLHMCAQG